MEYTKEMKMKALLIQFEGILKDRLDRVNTYDYVKELDSANYGKNPEHWLSMHRLLHEKIGKKRAIKELYDTYREMCKRVL